MTETIDIHETAHVATEDPGAVIVTRDFAAPPARVWRAFTEPALMQRWLVGMPGWTMPVCEMDVRVGGAFSWRWEETATGKGFGFDGTFREVVPPMRLVHTETYMPGDIGGEMGTCLVTLTLEPGPRGTRMVSRIDYDSAATRDTAMATGMTDGMEMSYSCLDGLLSEAA